jgi:hypothetical protein
MKQPRSTKPTRTAKQKRRQKPQRTKSAREEFLKKAQEERNTWLQRPRLHTALFEQDWNYDRNKKLLAEFGKPIPAAMEQRSAELKRRMQEVCLRFGWSEERLISFKELVVAYRQDPSPRNYLAIRQAFPELDIEISQFAGIDPLYALEDELRSKGVDPDLVAGVLDGDEPWIDKLSLLLLDLLVRREDISKDVPGHIERKRDAISDAMIEYLIVTMLEGLDRYNTLARIPGSLIVLIRYQLCGTIPDLHAAFLLKEKLQNAAIAVAQYLKPHEKVTARKLTSIVGVPHTTAVRWIKNPEFRKTLQLAQAWVASGQLDPVTR